MAPRQTLRGTAPQIVTKTAQTAASVHKAEEEHVGRGVGLTETDLRQLAEDIVAHHPSLTQLILSLRLPNEPDPLGNLN